ncbi:MAG: acyl-CoA dehydrogenase [Candidatus Aminicenantes bacterium]|nr:acyl-CoA dehydrogenase [Candidatus Aminicenantes bacterium]NIQ65196.1 acyl-CoA dehydrogenase [Candidatus Aminicenantes bacterium]NIT21199.1 acyl-CoA dehydrogenase [Candidatus Aminicenantes bacterium]
MNDVSVQQKIVEEAREFASKEIRPFAGEFEEKEAIPRELIDKMAQKGYLGACFPKEYGGLDLDPVYYGRFTEEIGKACSSTRAILTVHTSLVGETLLRCVSDEQKKKWLPLMAAGEKIGAFGLSEPEVGTDAKSVQTSYKKEGGRYIINGTKKWITLGDIADFFIIITKGEKGINAFIVEREREGVNTTPIKGLLAGRSDHIAYIELNNVEVPAENLVGKEGSGFTYVVNTALDYGRYSIAWGGIGLAQEALEAMVSYSRKRSQFGQKIYQFQLIQGIIGDAVTKIHAGRALCLRAGELRRKGDAAAVMETTIAKYFTSKIAMEITTDAVQVHGGNGCCNVFPVERLFREAKILEIIEGTSQIQQGIISNYGLRKYYSPGYYK